LLNKVILEFAAKQQNCPTLLTSVLVKGTVCQSVDNHSNVSLISFHKLALWNNALLLSIYCCFWHTH